MRKLFVSRQAIRATFASLLILMCALIEFGHAQSLPKSLNHDLLYAVQNGDTAAIQALLDKGADINGRNSNGNAALVLAALMNRLEVVKYLLNRGPNVNGIGQDGFTPLIAAAQDDRRLPMTKVLLDAGANLNVQDNYGETALERAANNGQTETVRLLLERGAQIDIKNKWGGTALTRAIGAGHVDVVRLLIANGASVNARYSNKATPLIVAAYALSSTIKPSVPYSASEKATPRHKANLQAAKRRYLDIIKMLLDNGANVNAKDADGRTALRIVQEQQIDEAVRLLKKAVART